MILPWGTWDGRFVGEGRRVEGAAPAAGQPGGSFDTHPKQSKISLCYAVA